MPAAEVIRRPTLAGYGYPAGAEALAGAIEVLTRTDAAPGSARAVVVPHGSLRQSGAVAGATLGRVRIPRRCVIVAPSHTASPLPWRLMMGGAWRTPLGDVEIDAACAEALQGRCEFLVDDPGALRGEHAVEVVLPFLQRLGPRDLAIVPIVAATDEAETRSELGAALAGVIRMVEEPVLLIASSDLSHYAPLGRCAAQDRRLIEAMCALDGGELMRCVAQGDIRMCGAGAVACVLEAARALGARAGALIRYGTSAHSGGDPHAVIGYGGVVVE